MSYPTYPWGYLYPNELVQGAEYGAIVWLPIIAIYMTMIAIASGIAFILASGILIKSRLVARISPALFAVGLSISLVLLLGPLADLRRPDHFYMIVLNPHLIPTASTPGISPIALMSIVMWPLLVILFIVLALALGIIPRFRIKMPGTILRILAIILLIVSIIWSTYYSFLLQSSMAIFTFYNYLPLIPIEGLAESIAVGVGIIALPIAVHRINISANDLGILSLIASIGAGVFIVFRVMDILRIHLFITGSGIGEVLIKAIEPFNSIALAIALVILVIGLANLRISSRLVLATIGVLGIVWILIDRWMLIINTQLISGTMLTLIPYDTGFGVWILESIALLLFSLFIYIALTWIAPIRERIFTVGDEHG